MGIPLHNFYCVSHLQLIVKFITNYILHYFSHFQKPVDMKKIYILMVLMTILGSNTFGQVGINKDDSPPDGSAIFDLKSSEKGFLPQRMNTVQRDAIGSPASGLVIFNTDCIDLQIFNGSGWVPLGNAGMLSMPGVIIGNTHSFYQEVLICIHICTQRSVVLKLQKISVRSDNMQHG